MKKRTKSGIITIPRIGCKDIWNAFMAENVRFDKNDIPFCPSTKIIPKSIITWDVAKTLYHKNIKTDESFFVDSFVCFYMDDYKFDGPGGIWQKPQQLLTVLVHFSGAITPDFSTYEDFPDPVKRHSTYRMRLIGAWLSNHGIPVINNVRWGGEETFDYCFSGIYEGSTVAIGTVGGSPRKLIDRERFESGLLKMISVIKPETVIVYGSASYRCLNNLAKHNINVIAFQSQTAYAFQRRKDNE